MARLTLPLLIALCNGAAHALLPVIEFAAHRTVDTPVEPGDEVPSEDAVWRGALAKMSVLPEDVRAQEEGCQAILQYSLRTGDGDHVRVVNAGALQHMGEAMANFSGADGLMNSCAHACSQLVKRNRNSTLLLNGTTRVVELTVKHLQEHISDCSYLADFGISVLAGLTSNAAPGLAQYVEQVGGHDVLFDAMKNCPWNRPVQLAAWIGLLDHSRSPRGSQCIANHGGPLEGVRLMVAALRAHKGHDIVQDPVTLKSTVLQNIDGLLRNDADNAYLAAFMDAGLPEEVAAAMQEEGDVRATQSAGCAIMARLMNRRPVSREILRSLGAWPLMSGAVAAFQYPDDAAFAGTTVGAAFPVVPECRRAMKSLRGGAGSGEEAMAA